MCLCVRDVGISPVTCESLPQLPTPITLYQLWLKNKAKKEAATWDFLQTRGLVLLKIINAAIGNIKN